MKYKKQIVIICLFTFLFVPFNSPRKANAEILTLTSGTIIACAALALASGVIITNSDMIEDVGTRVFETIKNIDGAIEQVGTNIKINALPHVVSAVVETMLSLPIGDYFIDKNIEFSQDIINGYNRFPTFDITQIAKFREFNFTFTPSSSATGSFMLTQYTSDNSYGAGIVSFSANALEPITFRGTITWDSWSKYYQLETFVNGVSKGLENLRDYKNYVAHGFTLRSNVPGTLVGDYDESICIPYREENSKDVSNDKVLEFFPKGGSISAPLDKPLSYNPSIDKPFTKPSDLVDEGDIVVDKEESLPGDTPSTGDSLWDTLLSWLKTLIMPIINLLTSILEFLTSIIGSLISALSGLLEGLFVPSLSIDDLFVIPNGSGFGNIINLFDWNVFDITPKAYEFSTTLPFTSLVDGTSNPQTIEINIFENEVVKKYLPIVRNVLSYSLLISTIFIIVWHFLPKRDID